MLAATTPASEMRPLAFTRVRLSGSRRGTAAARVTPYALDDTRQPSASGNSHVDSVVTAVASPQTRNARIAMVAPMAQRRPWLNRSRNGPSSGATIANGSMVRPRNRATWPRASPVGTWKNSVPASEIATAASPAVLKACISISRDSPERSAPSALAARRACRRVNRLKRPVPRATPATTLPVPRAPVPSARPTFLACSRRCPGGGPDPGSGPEVVMCLSCPARATGGAHPPTPSSRSDGAPAHG